MGRRSKRSWPGPRPRRAVSSGSTTSARHPCVFARQGEGGARASRAGTRPTRPHCGQEGENLRFSPSCQSPTFPSGRAPRVKTLSRKTAATHLLMQYEGEWLPPRRGARSARPSRPLRSDRREGCCCLVGREKVNWAEGPREAGLGPDSARRFIRLPAPWNDPSVTACGRASSPQRGAGVAGAAQLLLQYEGERLPPVVKKNAQARDPSSLRSSG